VERCGRVHPTHFSVHRRHINHLDWLAGVKYFHSCHKPNVYCDLRLSSTLIKRTFNQQTKGVMAVIAPHLLQASGLPSGGAARYFSLFYGRHTSCCHLYYIVRLRCYFESSRTTASRHPPSYSGSSEIDL
jgi:hypothetical protein